MQEIYEFVKECKTYFIATIDGDQARVRPFGTINLFDGKLYIQTGAKKNVSKQLHASPKAELCAYNGKAWVRISGEMILDERFEAQKSMLDAYPNLRGMYAEGDGNTEVWYFAPGSKAVLASFGGEPKEVIL